jgi:hypothetical protein
MIQTRYSEERKKGREDDGLEAISSASDEYTGTAARNRSANSLMKRTGEVAEQQRVTITDKKGMGMTKREVGGMGRTKEGTALDAGDVQW